MLFAHVFIFDYLCRFLIPGDILIPLGWNGFLTWSPLGGMVENSIGGGVLFMCISIERLNLFVSDLGASKMLSLYDFWNKMIND